MYRTWKRILAAVLPVLVSVFALSGCEPSTPTPLSGPSFNTTGTIKRVKKTIPVFSVTAIVGSEGGTIGNSDFSLTIPAGAVDVPTVFAVTSLSSGYLELELTATAAGSAITNDIGAAGFKVPLSFKLNYSGANNSTENLVMIWVRPDGVLEPVKSEVIKSLKLLKGELTHFSAYGCGEVN